MTEQKTNTYIRNGRVRVEPIKRSSDWLLPESDSAFMNTGAKIEYVVPNSLRTGALIDPLADLTEEQVTTIARELGFKDGRDLNINKPSKENYWINRSVNLDRNGKYLSLSNVSDFIAYKILCSCKDDIAPSYDERYDKGTYKFALVSEDEESKIKTSKVDIKKEAYMLFGKIDGSVRHMIDFLLVYYLIDKEAKRPPNNPNMEYCKTEIGRIIEEKTGVFLSIMSDPEFGTKALIQRAINNGLISRDGMTFTIFGESSSKNTLDGLINYLKDERNNNIRISIIGKLEASEAVNIPTALKSSNVKETPIGVDPNEELIKRMQAIEDSSKQMMEKNNELFNSNSKLEQENKKLREQLSERPVIKEDPIILEKKDLEKDFNLDESSIMKSELDIVKEELTKRDIKFHPATGLEKLKQKLADTTDNEE